MIELWSAAKGWLAALAASLVAAWLALRVRGEKARARALADDLARARAQRDAIDAVVDEQIETRLETAQAEIQATTEARLEEAPTPAAADASERRRAALLARLRASGDDS
jgi:hypothetical protein